ncbi:GNAT family N-acetyltransferase [Paeniglutamicibacter sp. NPDC091659]|uniref:GNAT family N-acetyltransferase n=1 Tax=Paeniglutamicibacter sp. NPDC091659 TaxID=3364389 RepID=UPI0037F33E12
MEISTERLALREYAQADQDAVHAFASDPRVCGFVEWGPNTPEDTRAFLRACLDEQTADPRQTFSMAIGVDGRVLGSIALMLGASDVAPVESSAEIGYVLAADAWGNGYATEAAAAMLDFARHTLGMRRVVATCRPENAGSIRVLEKAGLRRTGFLPGHKIIGGVAHDSLVFAIDL